MIVKRGAVFCLFVMLISGRCRAQDVIWDPTEIARMAEQAAQLSLAFSTTIEMGLQMTRLANGLGAAGPRGAPSLTGFASLSLPPLPQSGSARQQAAVAGFALALQTHQDLTLASGRAQQLAAQANSAGDARADMQANSAVCLAILAELMSIQSLLASSLQQASQH